MIYFFQYVSTHSDFLILINFYLLNFIEFLMCILNKILISHICVYLVSILSFSLVLCNDATFINAKIEFRETDPSH